MPQLKFIIDPGELRRLRTYFKGAADKMREAESDALNATMGDAKKSATAAISSEMTANRESVGKRIRFFKANPNDLSAVVKISGGRGLNLASFGAKQDSTGVVARVMGRQVVVPHAFVSSGINSGQSVVIRAGPKRVMTKGRYAGRVIIRGPRAGQALTRQPLAAERGPAVSDIYRNTPGLADRTENTIAIQLQAEILARTEKALK